MTTREKILDMLQYHDDILEHLQGMMEAVERMKTSGELGELPSKILLDKLDEIYSTCESLAKEIKSKNEEHDR